MRRSAEARWYSKPEGRRSIIERVRIPVPSPSAFDWYWLGEPHGGRGAIPSTRRERMAYWAGLVLKALVADFPEAAHDYWVNGFVRDSLPASRAIVPSRHRERPRTLAGGAHLTAGAPVRDEGVGNNPALLQAGRLRSKPTPGVACGELVPDSSG